jgi:hypothetical protein
MPKVRAITTLTQHVGSLSVQRLRRDEFDMPDADIDAAVLAGLVAPLEHYEVSQPRPRTRRTPAMETK